MEEPQSKQKFTRNNEHKSNTEINYLHSRNSNSNRREPSASPCIQQGPHHESLNSVSQLLPRWQLVLLYPTVSDCLKTAPFLFPSDLCSIRAFSGIQAWMNPWLSTTAIDASLSLSLRVFSSPNWTSNNSNLKGKDRETNQVLGCNAQSENKTEQIRMFWENYISVVFGIEKDPPARHGRAGGRGFRCMEMWKLKTSTSACIKTYCNHVLATP